MLNWAKGLFSSQAEINSQEDQIADKTDKIIEEKETKTSLSNQHFTMDTPRELASDQLSVTGERNGTSIKKSKKGRKNKKMGGSASVLQRENQIAGNPENSENIGASEPHPARPQTSEESKRVHLDKEAEDEGLLETGTAKSSMKKEKRRRQKMNHDTPAEDHNVNRSVAGSEKESIAQEDTTTPMGFKKMKKKGKKSIPREPTEDDVDQSMVDVEVSGQQEIAIPISSVTKKKDRQKKHKSRTSHSASMGEDEIPNSEEPEDQKDLTLTEEKLKKKKKSKSEKAYTLEVAVSYNEAQGQDVAHSNEESNSVEGVDGHPIEQFHLPKSNTGKRKKLQQYIEGSAIQDLDTERRVSNKPILPPLKTKQYVTKPKNPKIKPTGSGDANSTALLNQSISARKKSYSESGPVVPSAKALGKRPARDEPVEHQLKKRKQIDADPRNGDIRSMFPDDAPQNGENSSVAALKTSQRMRISTSNVEVAISSPAVKTSRSANEEMAGWTAADRRSALAGNNKELLDDELAAEEASVETSVARRKRYLPVDEPSLVGLETSKSGKNPKQKQAKSEQASSKKLSRVSKDPSSKVKPKRSRSQSMTRPKDGNGRLDEKETTRIADAVELYRVDNDLKQSAVNSIIQGNAITDGKKFWDFMKEEVPDIPKRNLQSWCRRNFHNYAARGVWSTEQDEELMQIFNRMPKKWSLIGAELNRLPDDCRDRWRNYLSVTNLELGPWKLEEELQLKDAVKKCIELIREDRRREGLLKPEEEDDDTYHEHYISWMKVSELMDLSRSHLQCYRKWKAIKAREHATTDDLVAERIVISNSWKHLKNYQDASKSLATEKLQFLRAIRESKAGAESKIDWRAIEQKLDRNYDAMEMRICLRGLMQNIQGHESKPLQENVKTLIKAFEESAPHEPEGYIDLPFESTGLKKRTKRSKTSFLFENNPELYDVGGSSSKPKMRHRMLKQDESPGNQNFATNADDDEFGDTIQVPDSAKKAKRPAPAKKPARTSDLSTERVTASDSDDGAPTSAQKPQSEDEDIRKPRRKIKKTTSQNRSHRAARTQIFEHSSDDEQERQLESDSNLDSEDVEMADAQNDSNDEDSNDETSQSSRFQVRGGGSNGYEENDNSAHNHPPIDSDDDSEMQDSDELQVPATPEYELREGHSEMREQSVDFDDSGQVYEMGEGENQEEQLQMEDDEESLMDDMSDIPAKVVKKKTPGVNGEGDTYFGREASVDLDQ